MLRFEPTGQQEVINEQIKILRLIKTFENIDEVLEMQQVSLVFLNPFSPIYRSVF